MSPFYIYHRPDTTESVTKPPPNNSRVTES
jgi:hypothetical protein